MAFIDLAKNRYSVRKYSEQKVEDEKLKLVLEAGMVAPTAKNIQPWRVYVLKSDEAIEKIRSLTPMAFNAPIVLLFTYNRDEQWKNELEEGFTSGIEDTSIVATHMMLEACDLGLGTCWVNWFSQSKIHEAFNLPENEEVVLLMPLGYPSESSPVSPSHNTIRNYDELIKEL